MFKTILFILFITVSTSVFAGAGKDRLDAFFSDVSSIRADFKQQVLGNSESRLQETSGKMLLLRPGRFRWDYKKPYEQQIISNGKKVWLYDIDLEQVTVKTVDGVLGSTPALLLSSNTPIEQNFTVNELGEEQNLQWVELLPLDKESSFERLVLAFDKDNLVSMELHDVFGQLTRLIFTNIERNPIIDPEKFEFIPPEGVDVIGENAKK